MTRRILGLSFIAALVLSVPLAKADPPLYEPRVLPGVSTVLPAAECTAESAFELGGTRYTNTPPFDKCERLRVVFGPIWAKPGQNDVLIQPVTFEKPYYPGYLVRFKPDLVAVDGTSPHVKDVHLHHGTWLNAGFLTGDPTSGLPVDPLRRYGSGPWIASGEEKTIAVWAEGYGLKILPSDQWAFLHMIHNATAQTFPVWVTYDLDFIPEAAAEAPGPDGKPLIRNTKGIWLDVGDCSWSTACRKDTWNPIFNIQRGYGTGGVCVFPRENCAQQNTFAGTSAQQGNPIGTFYDDTEIKDSGTLVIMGGHLHYGGLRDEVSLGRDFNLGKTDAEGKPLPPDWHWKLIHVSDALYWDHTNPDEFDAFDLTKNVVGGVPDSWDMVMTGVSKDIGWSVRVKAGDRLRTEGIYDSTMASWYEQMGIVMTWIAPGDDSGMDPFDPGVTIDYGINTRAVNPPTVAGYTLPGGPDTCTPDATTLCARGQATHARIETSADHWSCEFNRCPDIARTARDGAVTSDIHLGGFTYGEADLGVIGTLGIPTVRRNTPVTFWNADTSAYAWHTVTRCANPCSGTTSASYPIPDGAWDDMIGAPPPTIIDPVERRKWVQEQTTAYVATNGPDLQDFDSGQLGIGTGAANKVSWKWTPKRAGTYTFFCRIHPSMRGAIRVT